MSENVNGRYAEILFAQASKVSSLDVVYQDFQALEEMIQKVG